MTNISINYDQKFINKSMKSPLLNKKEERVMKSNPKIIRIRNMAANFFASDYQYFA